MKITIREVARKSQVGKSTVSRVLNNSPHVSEAKRKKILATMKALAYRPNTYARNILRKKARTIALAFSKNIKNHLSYNPFFIAVMHAIEGALSANGYLLSVMTLNPEYQVAHKLPDAIFEHRADGLILLGHIGDDYLRFLKKEGVKFVSVEAASLEESINAVVPDHYRAGYLVTKHLIDLGHKRIGFSRGPMEYISVKDRFRAYRDVLESADISGADQLVYDYTDDEQAGAGNQAVAQALLRPAQPTAIMFLSDVQARQAIAALQAKGLNVPADMSVTGFGGTAMAFHSRPRLTTINVPVEEMGHLAVQRLIKLIESNENTFEKLMLPVELVIGESTGPALN